MYYVTNALINLVKENSMIDLQSLSFHYRKGEVLFDGLNLKLTANTMYGLLGKNGAGKTTLFKILTGLVFPKNGSCQVFGFTPEKRAAHFLHNVYVLSEEFYSPSISIKNYVKYFSPLYPRFSHEALQKYLDGFSLSLTKNFSSLSYGQKKKFLLAFGLATNARLLLLDEPTNGLDIPTKSSLRKLLAEALTNDRMIIISTHQVRDVENLIDHIIILDKGKIIFNENMFTVSKELTVTHTEEIKETNDVLFREKTLAGYSVMSKKTSREASQKIDLELLFNAVINENEKMKKVFSKESSYVQ